MYGFMQIESIKCVAIANEINQTAGLPIENCIQKGNNCAFTILRVRNW